MYMYVYNLDQIEVQNTAPEQFRLNNIAYDYKFIVTNLHGKVTKYCKLQILSESVTSASWTYQKCK